MLPKTTLLAAMSVALLASPSWAQSEPGMDHSAHAQGHMADYMATMDTMMAAMEGMTSSGDADADFLLMMIPHHQSATDMAEVELAQGDDPETREMAQTIIDAQKQEIADMQAMLERLEAEAPQ